MAKQKLIIFLFLSLLIPTLLGGCASFSLPVEKEDILTEDVFTEDALEEYFVDEEEEYSTYSEAMSELHFIPPLPVLPCPQVARINPPDPKTLMLNSLKDEIDTWIGTPHCLGGNSNRCIDCSGLVRQIYKDLFDIELPRTSSEQMQLGKKISKNELKPGDLVFFRISNRRPRIRNHVGIYLSNNNFVHTSVRSGVTISNLSDPYWKKAFWKARRIVAPPNKIALIKKNSSSVN